jgi:monoamine oxidase
LSVDVDVVIVGGGAAGVGAARRLAHSGLSAMLLEAHSRLGGRAWTRNVAGHDLDLGCGWLHSAEHNAWVRIARDQGLPIDESPAAWGVQYHGLGFAREEQNEARKALADWTARLASSPPASDRASDALIPDARWNNYIRTIAGFISGASLERLSAADYVRYDETSTETNWRVSAGLGTLVARSAPAEVAANLDTPVESISLGSAGLTLATRAGTVRARAALLTVSTEVLANGTIKLPPELDGWRNAAARLPLGRNEKLFFEILGDAPFEAETQVIGNPRDTSTGAYYLRPLGRPVIEAFFGGDGARKVEKNGIDSAFAFALDQLVGLFGSGIRGKLRPLAASAWSRDHRIGGSYSYALPGSVEARAELARSFDQRIFFAGEATSRSEFSTVHGAHDSGVRAAEEAIAALSRKTR